LQGILDDIADYIRRFTPCLEFEVKDSCLLGFYNKSFFWGNVCVEIKMTLTAGRFLFVSPLNSKSKRKNDAD
jgi:hypothetical protein